jgi:hypothetical protein
MENAADIKAWCEERWNDRGVINARDRNVFVQGPGGIAIKAGSSPWYKSKEQKAYEARFGIYNKKLVPIILAEANKSDASYMVLDGRKLTGPIYTWPKDAPAAPDMAETVPHVPRKRVSHKKVTQAAAIIAKVPEHELTAFLARFGLSLSLAASIASLDNAEQIARQFLRATL